MENGSGGVYAAEKIEKKRYRKVRKLNESTLTTFNYFIVIAI